MARMLFAAALLAAFACARSDPFDDSSIARDLKRRPAQQLYDEADRLAFHPAPHARLSERQIADFLRMMQLARRIRAVAEKDFGRAADQAANDDSRLTRIGDAFAALGTARSYATAELRASLDLGFNPHEQQWIASRIFAAAALMPRAYELDRFVAQAKANRDIEADPDVVGRKQAELDDTVAAKHRWEDAQDADVRADLRIVERHRTELREVLPELPAD